jgi:hypothetical protein
MSEQEMLVVASKVKNVLREMDVNVGKGSLESLNGVLYWYLQQASARAKANGRKTVQPHDFVVMEG